MKKIIIASMVAMLFGYGHAVAQPAAVKKAVASVFSLKTFTSAGEVQSTAPATFVAQDGIAVAAWKAFDKAESVTATDAKGNTLAFDALLGADEIYNVAKLRVKSAKVQPLPLGSASEGDEVWVVPSAELGTPLKAKVKSVDKVGGKYNYYVLYVGSASDKLNGAAVVSAKGQLIGIYNQSGTLQSATDAAYARDIVLTGMSQNDPTMRRARLRIGLPDEEKEAIVGLLLSSSQKPTDHEATIREFIDKFPHLTDGYYALTMLALTKGDNAQADSQLRLAVEKATKKGEAHFNYANVIYLVLTGQQAVEGDVPSSWTLDKALSEAREANRVDAQFLYQHLAAKITYAQGSYQDAFTQFEALAKQEPMLPETYLEMAQCKEQLGASDREVLDLLEQSVAVCDTPYVASSAPYFYARGLQYAKVGEYRKAMVDLVRYEYFNQGQLDASFYYQREQIELQGKLYQQALGDILTACRMAPETVAYHAEAGSLYLRVNRPQDAAEAARHCIEVDPESADGYLILGVAQTQLNQKEEGIRNIEKAKSLGNEQADNFLKKFKR